MSKVTKTREAPGYAGRDTPDNATALDLGGASDDEAADDDVSEFPATGPDQNQAGKGSAKPRR